MTKHSPFCTFALLCALSLAACTKEPAAGANPSAPASGAHMDDGHGEKKPLGAMTIGAHTFDVVQAGDVVAGKEAYFDVVFAAGKPIPSTVRAWVGVESGEGSVKAKLGKEGDRALHGHVEVPKTIPAGSKLWIEIEENGKPSRGSIAWK